jgi:choline transport protein
MSSVTVTSRIGFAMARDDAFPWSSWLKVVNPWVGVPLRVVLLVVIFDVLLLTLPLATPLAFAAITSITTIGFQISYAIPILQRATGGTQTLDTVPPDVPYSAR